MLEIFFVLLRRILLLFSKNDFINNNINYGEYVLSIGVFVFFYMFVYINLIML